MLDPSLDEVDVKVRAGAGKLPDRERSWPTLAALSLASSVAVFAGADLVGYGQWAIPGSIALGSTSACTVAYGIRRRHRDITIDRAVEKLYAPLGWAKPGRALLKVHGWRKGMGGDPLRFALYYNGAGLTVIDDWLPSLKKSVNKLGWGPMEVTRHDDRACVIEFASAAPSEAGAEDLELARVKRTTRALFGAGSTLHNVEFNDAGELSSFTVDYDIAHKLAASGYRARLERVVSATFAGRWRARWKIEEDTVRFELRPALPQSLWNPEAPVPDGQDLKGEDYDKTEIPFALDEDGVEHVWRPGISPHFLLTGTTGSGKTATAHSILIEFAKRGWPIWTLDAKLIEFLGFQDYPNVQVLASTLPEQCAVLHRAHQLMDQRYQDVVNGIAKVTDFEPLLFIVDEFADFKSALLEWYPQVKVKGDPNKPPVLGQFQSLARKSRTARIHMLVSLQRPDAEIIPGEARDNFRQRFSIGRLSPDGAGMMWESQAIGTTIPAGLRGRGISAAPSGEPVEVQGYRVPDPEKASDPDELAMLERMRPKESRHPRLLIVPPEPSEETLKFRAGTGSAAQQLIEDPDFVASVEPSYRDWCNAEWVRAEDFPHLDPVKKRQRLAETKKKDPLAGSTLSIFNLQDSLATHPNDDLAPVVELSSRTALSSVDFTDDDEDLNAEAWTGYADPRRLPASEIALGDLVCIDESGDEWAVIDSEPGDDFDNPHELLLTWRGVGDSEGSLGVEHGEYVLVRKPESEKEYQ